MRKARNGRLAGCARHSHEKENHEAFGTMVLLNDYSSSGMNALVCAVREKGKKSQAVPIANTEIRVSVMTHNCISA
jgi:hypothetical protein